MLVASTPAPLSSPTTLSRVAVSPYPRYLPPPRGLGDFASVLGAIANPIGTIVGSIFGSRQRDQGYDYARDLANIEAGFQTNQLLIQKQMADALIAAQDNISQRETAAYERAVALEIAGAERRARIEQSTLRDQFNAQLESVRIWREAQASAAMSDMAEQAQSGVFSIAAMGIQSAQATATTFPKTAVVGMVLVAGVAMLALSWAKKSPGKKRRGGRRAPAAASTSAVVT